MRCLLLPTGLGTPLTARSALTCRSRAIATQTASPLAARPVHRATQPRRMAVKMAAGLEDLDAKLGQLDSGFVLFKADWCPDCVRSTDAVRQAVKEAGSKLLEVDVAAQPMAWKTPAHPLRQDERFKLGGIPTLVHWQGGKVAAKLGSELERAPTTAAAGQVAAAFIKQALGQ